MKKLVAACQRLEHEGERGVLIGQHILQRIHYKRKFLVHRPILPYLADWFPTLRSGLRLTAMTKTRSSLMAFVATPTAGVRVIWARLLSLNLLSMHRALLGSLADPPPALPVLSGALGVLQLSQNTCCYAQRGQCRGFAAQTITSESGGEEAGVAHCRQFSRRKIAF